MTEPLDPTERKVYHFLLDYLAEHTFQPSVREIGRQFRIRSTKTVAQVLQSLETKGYIRRNGPRSRGVQLIGYAGPNGTQPVSLYARAHGAPPTLRPEDVVQRLTLDRRLLPSDDAFLVRVEGDAAPGIRSGDLAIVAPTSRAADGDVVAVRIGEWIQVGALHRRGAMLELGAGGPAQTLGPGDDYAVLGVVQGIVRTKGGSED